MQRPVKFARCAPCESVSPQVKSVPSLHPKDGCSPMSGDGSFTFGCHRAKRNNGPVTAATFSRRLPFKLLYNVDYD